LNDSISHPYIFAAAAGDERTSVWGAGSGGAPRAEAEAEAGSGREGEVVADEIREVVSRSRRGADAVEEELFRRDSLPRQQLVRSGRGTSAVSFHSP